MSSSTVSRRIKEALKLTGIDVSILKGHSTRAVSSSKASKVGLSLADTSLYPGRGSWSSRSTWQRFYNKQIMNEDDIYQKTVFS